MAHRSLIGIKYPDEHVSAVYVGKGSLPDSSNMSVMRTLNENYSSTEAMHQLLRFSEVKGFQFLPSRETWRETDIIWRMKTNEEVSSDTIFSWEILPDKPSKTAKEILGCVSKFWHAAKDAENIPSSIYGNIEDIAEIAGDFCCEYVYLWEDKENSWTIYEIHEDEDILLDITNKVKIDTDKTFSVSAKNIEESITYAIKHIQTLHSGVKQERTSRDVFVDIEKTEFKLRELYDEELDYILEILISEVEKHPESLQLSARTTGGLDEEIEPHDIHLVIHSDTEQDIINQPDWVMDLMMDGICDKHGILHHIHIDTSSKKLDPSKILGKIVWQRQTD